MSIEAIVEECIQNKVFLTLENSQLKLKFEGDSLDKELLAKIKNNKQQLIKLLQNKAQEKTRHDAIPMLADREKSLPSYAQQRLWLAEKFETGDSHYNISAAYRLTGKLNEIALTKALQSIFFRHEVLRSVFYEEDEQLYQKLVKEAILPFKKINLRTLKGQQQEDQANKIILDDDKQVYQLTAEYPFRVCLLQLSINEYIIIFNMHHIASDGWSVNLFIREIGLLYEAYDQDKSNPLTPLSIQYTDYAQWQRKNLQGELLGRQLNYWKQRLKGFPQTHSLPLDNYRPVQQNFSGQCYQHLVNKILTEEISNFCLEHKVTLFMFLQSVFSILLCRYSNENDILIGSPIAGRTHKDVESLIGFFINTIVLRSKFDGDPTFLNFLDVNRKNILDAYTHQEVPFDLLVEELKPQRSLSFSPVTQIRFILQNNERTEFSLSGLDLLPIKHSNDVAKFDITLTVIEKPEGLLTDWSYNSDIFTEQTIQAYANSFLTLLNHIVSLPTTTVQNLPLLDDEQLRVQNYLWNSNGLNAISQVDSKCIQQIFSEQVEKTPEKMAIACENKILTYQQLNAQSNQLAHYLISQGVQTGTLVGLYFYRSIEMVVAILGVLKAGAAYVPLDPGNPRARLSHILNDSSLQILLTHSVLNKHLIPDREDAIPLSIKEQKILCLDNAYEKELLQKQQKTNPRLNKVSVTAGNLAYVIYTSGSTGKPKGVLIEHGNVSHFYQVFGNQLDELGVTEDSGWLWNSSYAFDASVKGILALCQGRSVILTSNEQGQSVDKIIALLSEYNMTAFNGPPLLVERIVERLEEKEQQGEEPQQAMNFIIGGDNIERTLWNKITNYCHKRNCKAFNAYGPTETTINSCYAKIDCVDKPGIGQAVDNTCIYVLNESGQPLPTGAIGELYIGGSGLARGYLNHPELTAEYFVDLSFNHYFSAASEKVERLYKSGDLVYCRADGQLVFVGRKDKQIKIRGYRIELEEIRHQLTALPLLKDALVLVAGGGDTKKLLAYVVPGLSAAIDILDKQQKKQLSNDYRKELLKVLPEYMVPDVYIFLDKIPLTVGGKVDVLSLPQQQESDLQNEEYAQPDTEIEELLCFHWKRLLKLSHIGVDDNFYKIGGHSLIAMKLLASIEKEFKIDMDIRDLFENLTIRLQAQLIEGKLQSNCTQPDKHKKIDTTSEQKSLEKSTDIPKLVDRKNVPLSYAQQRLWFIDQLEGGSGHYNIPAAFKLEGDFNEKAFKKALLDITVRHEILRTRFNKSRDQVYQHICENAGISLVLVNLFAIKSERQQSEINKYLIADAHKIYDLANDHLLRVHLFKVSPRENILLFNMHHIISDAWSVGILVRELNLLYQAHCHGQNHELPELPIQYADYASWQREWLQGEVLFQQLEYWKHRLDGIPRVHSLPLDRPRPSQQSFAGQSWQQTVNKDLGNKIRDLCREMDVTLFMFLQSAFSVLLARYSNETDIVIGSPIAGRMHKDIEFLIGFFVNSLVLRNNLDGDPAFTDLLLQNKQVILEAYANQHVPFDLLVEELKPDRSLSYSPINQIRFVFHKAENNKLSLSGLKTKAVEYHSAVAKYDMVLTIIDNGEELVSHWSYSTDIFDRQTIQAYSDNYMTLLSSIVTTPAKNIQALPVLSEQTLHQQLVEWNNQRLIAESPCCIHQLFEQQAKKTPEHIAVVFKDKRLSYKQLNEQANQLAHYLISQGIKPDTLFALYFDRSLEMLIAILGVLKAGAAYVPLDTANPLLRIAYMLEDSAAEMVLTTSLLKKQLLAVDENTSRSIIVGRRMLVLDHNEAVTKIQRQKKLNPDISGIKLTPQHLAYVIYTSGSSGKPKGVLVEHHSVSNFYHIFTQQLKLLNVNKSAGWLWNASYAFDASVKGIMALCQGRTVRIASNEQVQDVNEIISLLVIDGIQVFNGPPLLVERVLEKLLMQKITGINLIVSGDVINKDLWGRLINYCQSHNCRAINAYGPTEATVNASFVEITDNYPTVIGKPVCNSFLYVLNPAGLPVPVGSIGELHIGGGILARAYLNQPELSAEKFIANPFSDNSADRLYKTGDLVRYRKDGNLIFVGRNDQQIKVRGYRLELDEIKNILAELETVQDALVLVKKVDDEKKIIAYVVPSVNAKVITLSNTRNQLINYYEGKLTQVLPAYMVPQVFVLLEKIPLTAGGKPDLQALPELDDNRLSSSDYVEPGNDIEKSLHNLWQSLLKTDCISIDDNFFKVGGHSLLAMKLMTSMEKDFAVSISVRDLFVHRTIRQQAQLISEKAQEQSNRPNSRKHKPGDNESKSDYSISNRSNFNLPRLQNRHKTRLSYAQQRLWFIDQLEGNSTHYNISSAFRLTGCLNLVAFALALRSIMQRHEVLRSFYGQIDGLVYQLLDEKFQLPLNYTDLSLLPKSQQQLCVEELLSADEQKSYLLSVEYPLRISLLKLSDNESIIFFNMHHIASDGWSLKILIDELNIFYQAYKEGEANPLQALGVQYADYAQWQQDWLQGEILEQQLSYWKTQLEDIPLVHSFPLDKPRPGKQSFAGRTHRHILHGDLTKKIKIMSQDHDVTLFMLLQTAFSVVLGRYSNETDIVMGSPIAGRTHKDLDPLVGFFVNTLVLRCNMDSSQTFSSLLETNKQTILDAYNYQHIPFEMLVEELMPVRSLSHSPLFQIVLHLHNNEESELNFSDLELVKIEKDTKYSKFDLELSVIDFGDYFVFYWVYNSDLFYGETIQRLSDNFAVLLNDIAHNPDKPIYDLSLLTQKEQYILLGPWNNTAWEFPADKCIHELFEEQVDKSPDAIALLFKDKQLSYRQLNERSNQLAHYLLAQGLKPGTPVGFHVERSPYMIIALLGILKAGGAYVPLDPAYPEARLNYMLSDSAVSVVLSLTTLQGKISFAEYHRVIYLDDENFLVEAAGYSTGNIGKEEIDLCSRQLAYIIYTSGSTGKPKGVALEHSGLVNLALSQSEEFQVQNSSRVLQFASLSFDAATSEWAMTLTKGATLVLVPLDTLRSGQALSSFIKNKSITHATLPPTLLPHLDNDECQCLKHLIVAGENCPELLAAEWLKGRELYNAYGPTETTVCASIAHYKEQLQSWHMGQPINNVFCYVLNERQLLCPVGAIGELYIGGTGVARGYLNQPELSNQTFIDNPFPMLLPQAGKSYFYKTGDLVRWLADGCLKFIGRVDEQVKIRGFRIELSEIEKQLSGFQQIKESVVLLKNNSNNDKYLIAYLVADGSFARMKKQQLIATVRQQLKAVLPEYMIPGVFITLDNLPLTVTGKLDRKALPEPAEEDYQKTDYVAPGNDIQYKLCELWERILGLKKVGIHDNFFGLGGHSLLATQLVTRLCQLFEVNIPVKAMFEMPTIIELSVYIEVLLKAQVNQIEQLQLEQDMREDIAI